jgi:hypothetical protein
VSLADALAAARNADRLTRIEWRDRIAAHGVAAIEAVEPWVADRELGAFAVRVIEAVGRAGETDAAVGSLISVQRLAPTDHVRDDIERAIERLHPRAAPRGSGAGRTQRIPARAGVAWPGFQPHEFGRVEGTTWRRSRDPVGLVPLLLRPLQEIDSAFASFPIYMMPVVHLADRDRYQQGGEWGQGWRASKLIVSALGPTQGDPSIVPRVVAGYYIERGPGTDEYGPIDRARWDWPRLIDVLRDPVRRRPLELAVARHHMQVGDYPEHRLPPKGCAVGFRAAPDDRTLVIRDHGGSVIASGWDAVALVLEALPETDWRELYIWREWPADEAINPGPSFARRELVPVLLDLARVYLDVIGAPGLLRHGDR